MDLHCVSDLYLSFRRSAAIFRKLICHFYFILSLRLTIQPSILFRPIAFAAIGILRWLSLDLPESCRFGLISFLLYLSEHIGGKKGKETTRNRFPFWTALGRRCRLKGCSWLPLLPCLASLSPFVIALLGCPWLPLPPCLPACFPSRFPFFWAALGCRCGLVCRACLLHDSLSGLLLAAAAALSPSLFPCLF